MTSEEAIKTIQAAIAAAEWECPMDYAAAFELAIAALRAQAEAERNEPLTLAELLEMDGDKIYIHYIDGFYADEDGAYWGKFESLVRECEGKLTACNLPLKYYGKTWLAYLHKPKEVAGNG